MKVRFVRSVLVDVQKARLQEVWDKQFRRWDEVRIDSVVNRGDKADLVTEEGDTLMDVPLAAFELLR